MGPTAVLPNWPGIVDDLEAAGVDSLWFSELVYSHLVDPFVGMAFTLARTNRIKVGTSVAVLPGRHPVLVAKQLASLSAVAPKRVLPVFGLRSALPVERDLFLVPDGKRAAVFDESLKLLRVALREDMSTSRVTISPRRDAGAPETDSAAGYLDRRSNGCGLSADRHPWRRLAGKLPDSRGSGRARQAIIAAADEAGREIEPDHYGINLAVGDGELPAPVLAAIRKRRPDLDPAELVAADWPTLHRRLDEYIEAGLTKFVIRPAGGSDTADFLEAFVEEVTPRQN